MNLDAGDRGLSLLELTIAMGLMAALTASLFAMLHPTHGAFATAPEAADLQQRLRVAVDVLSKEISIAGAGAFVGDRAGPLVGFFAPLRPGWSGSTSDALTVMYIPGTAVQTVASADLMPASRRLEVAAGPGCPVGAALCGVRTGMTLLVYDEAGNADALRVVGTTAQYVEVENISRTGGPRPMYPSGSKVAEAVIRTYWRKRIASPPTDQLMRNDEPVLDHVVGLTFEYFAEREPPVLTTAGPTYGPAPPPLTVQTSAYPAGENCTFQVDGETPPHVSRLPSLDGNGPLVKLDAAQLTDGPWCPDDTDGSRWDADLLRVRKIGIAVRVEVAPASLRGPAGRAFTNGGTSRDGRWVPDVVFYWEVAPRNMN